jgi:hypothetical protein
VSPAGVRRAELWIGGAVLAVGTWGLVLARHLDFTTTRGARIDDSVQFSPLGALLTVVLAALALAGAAAGLRRLVLVVGAGFGVMAVATLLVLEKSANVFGARGSNVSLFLGAAVGLVALATAPPG